MAIVKLLAAAIGVVCCMVLRAAEIVPPFGPNVVRETTAFYDAADDFPDEAVMRYGREVVPFELKAGAREVALPMTRQVWNGFERVKIFIDADFDGEDCVTGAVLCVSVCPGMLPQFSAGPSRRLSPRPVARRNGRLVIEVAAQEIGESAKIADTIFPSNFDEIRLLRRADAPAAMGYLATVDLVKEGFRESFSCDNGDLFIANLDDPAKCRPHFTLANDGPACEGTFTWRLYDQPTGKTYAKGRVERKFADGERLDVVMPKPDKAGCYHVDYTIVRKGGYRYSHTVSYAAMHPAGQNGELFSDDFKFSCLAHLESYSMNERRRMMAYMREMGANYTRAVDRYWSSLQPNGPCSPFVGWKRYVKGIDICLSNGVERSVSILCAPKWAEDPERNAKIKSLKHYPRMDFLADYAAEFSRGLAGRVREFEGNNEPNLSNWSQEYMADYEKTLYRALKAARPDAVYKSGEWGCFSGNWDDEYYVKYNPDCWDVWAQHYHRLLSIDGLSVVAHLEELRRRQGITKPWMGDECANAETNQHLQAADMFCKNIHGRGHGAVGMTWYNLRCKGSMKPLRKGEPSFGMLTWDFCPRGVYVAFNSYVKTFRRTVLKGAANLYPGLMSWRYEGRDRDEALYPLWSMNRRYRSMTLSSATDARTVEEIDLYGNVRPLPVKDGRVVFSASRDPVTLRLVPRTASLGRADLVSADEIPGFNRAVATAKTPATFRANTAEQYTQIVPSSAENDDLVWRSPEDLSGYLLVFRPEGANLAVRICVDDDVHRPGEKGYKMYEGDGFQLMMLVPGQNGTWEIGGAWHDDDSTDVWVWAAPEGVAPSAAREEISLTAHRNMKVPRKTIWYDLRIPLRLLGTDAAGIRKSGIMLNAMINDNDGRCREGYISFSEGNPKDPDNFMAVDFEDTPSSPPVEPPRLLKVLAIGNSFSHSLMAQLPACANALPGAELDFATLVIGGCSLKRHWENVEKSDDPDFRPYDVCWSFASAPAKDKPPFGDAMKDGKANIPQMLKAVKWDIVTIQQVSSESWYYKSYQPYADNLIAKIRELAPQAEVRVQQTWAYCNASERICGDATPGKPGTFGVNQKGMYEGLASAYDKLAERHHLRLIPAGDAVEAYRKALPTTFKPPTRERLSAFRVGEVPDMGGDPVGSYSWRRQAEDGGVRSLECDPIHLNKEGQYLQACTWIAALFDDDLSRLSYKPDFLSERRAALMRKCAAESVKARQTSASSSRFVLDDSVMSDSYWNIWNKDEQSRIDRDIERNRKKDAVVKIDAPVGTEVDVEQLSHAFYFGAQIFNYNQLGRKEWNDKYKDLYGTVFNSATVAFYWPNFEPLPNSPRFRQSFEDGEGFWNACVDPARQPHWRRPATDGPVNWCRSRGVRVHGHPLVYLAGNTPIWLYGQFFPQSERDRVGFPDVPPDAFQKSFDDWRRDYYMPWYDEFRQKHSEEEFARLAPVFTANLRRLQEKRIAEIAAYYGDRVDSWDVVNETRYSIDLSRPIPSGAPVVFGETGIEGGDFVYNAFTAAAERFPESVKLNINDNTVDDRYTNEVDRLISAGLKVDVIGMQMHLMDTNTLREAALAGGERTSNEKVGTQHWEVGSPAQVRRRVARLAPFKRPLHVSEVTISAPGTDIEALMIQAVFTRNLYRAWFSQKEIVGITWWNVVDGCGYDGEPTTSGLFTRDMQPKPVFLMLKDLICREWRTRLTAKTDADGKIHFRGFCGRYRVSWRDKDADIRQKIIEVK